MPIALLNPVPGLEVMNVITSMKCVYGHEWSGFMQCQSGMNVTLCIQCAREHECRCTHV